MTLTFNSKTLNSMNLSSNEQLVIEKLRSLGPWGSLIITKQSGEISMLETCEREKLVKKE